MSVGSGVPYNPHVGNGLTTVFAYGFTLLDADDLVVTVDGVVTSAYTVSGIGAPAGGSITFSAAPANGAAVLLQRVIQLVRSTDYQTNGDFLSPTVNADFDRLWMAVQNTDSSAAQALRVPEIGALPYLPAAADRANKLQGYDSAGNPIAVVPSAGTATALATSLASSLLPTEGIGQIGANPTLNYVTRTLGAGYRDLPWNPCDYPWLAAGDDSTDDTAAVQACIDQAFAAGKGGIRIPSMMRIAGTLQHRSGVTIFGDSSTDEYYPSSPYSTIRGAGFHKHSGDAAGPIIALETSSGLRGLYILYERVGGATTGIIRMGGSATSDVCYYSSIRDCRIYGTLTADVTGASTCYGVFFPESVIGKQRYYNHITDTHITNCDVALRLGGQSNANNFSNLTTRQCYWHVEINGGSTEAVENVFSLLNCHNIGVLPTTGSVVFVLKNAAKFNVFSGFATECNGATWNVDDTCSYNKFYGTTNETTASILPVRTAAGALTYNDFIEYTARVNVVQQSEMLLPTLNTGQRFFQGLGNKVSLFRTVSGTLPQCNGGAYPQALVAADADSRVIVQFDGTAFKKSIHPTFFCKLKVFASAPSAGGTSVAECEFLYRPTSTGSAAGVLSVLRCSVKGTAIAGLHFISGKTGATEFRIGLVGGVSVASSMNFVAVSMEIEGLSYDANTIDMSKFANFGFTSTAATANDVSDAVTLLTVADTVI